MISVTGRLYVVSDKMIRHLYKKKFIYELHENQSDTCSEVGEKKLEKSSRADAVEILTARSLHSKSIKTTSMSILSAPFNVRHV